LGARVVETAFSDQFKGLTGELALGSGVTAISGATISSKAVVTAVNDAMKLFEKAIKEAS
jgi:hypothetical protein